MELMALLYVLLAKARKEGTLTHREADIDDPSKSPIFTRVPEDPRRRAYRSSS